MSLQQVPFEEERQVSFITAICSNSEVTIIEEKICSLCFTVFEPKIKSREIAEVSNGMWICPHCLQNENL